ncbi:MAG: hypothetical protein HY365_01830, partial [Candidatus Aenigmarchaeota archaeon]|nr:hypothetical protein [Candidatus Aenigmarchaeota archaeon]
MKKVLVIGSGAIKIDDFKKLYMSSSYMRRSRIRTKQEFATHVKWLVSRNRNALNYNYLRMHGRNDLLYEAVKLFGSWRNSCYYCGLSPMTKHMKKDEIISEIRLLSKKLGKSPTRDDAIAQMGYGLTRAAERRFGNWSSALIASGVTPHKRYDWSRAVVLEDVRAIAKKIGHTPSMNELRRLGRHDLLNALFVYFATYNEFLTSADLELVAEMNKWSEETVINEIKDLHAMFGRMPTRTETEAMGKLDLKMAATRLFGSWNNAVIAAGIVPNKDALGNDLGKRWEMFIMRIVKNLFKCPRFHVILPNRTIPDVMLPKNIILEIKSNASDSSV